MFQGDLVESQLLQRRSRQGNAHGYNEPDLLHDRNRQEWVPK